MYNKPKRKRIILGIVVLVALVFSYIYINEFEIANVYSKQKDVEEKIKDMEFYLGGDAVGIKLLASGVLVMSVDNQDLDLKVGDVILSVNEEEICTGARLMQIAKESNGNKLMLTVNRNDKILEIEVKPILDSITNEYKLGLFVKDSSAGVGTVTFYEKTTSSFAALGHGVTETTENYILPITGGAITNTHIYSIKKGEAKKPGEIKGTISSLILGEITSNTNLGIYGNYFKDNYEKRVEIMKKTEIKEGKASIIVTLEDGIKEEYEITIEKVILTSTGNKNMIIRITDEKLLEKTGGIIQGMSGCPILQNKKLVGAVTHVLLNDATRGYGVFIENMICDMEKSK